MVFFCLKMFFTFSNRADPDEMQHYAAFYLGLHYLQKYLYWGFLNCLILMVFLKEFFEKVDFGKNLQTTKKHTKFHSRQKVYPYSTLIYVLKILPVY